jgi:hypothetical protein
VPGRQPLPVGLRVRRDLEGVGPLTRSDPGGDPWVERNIPAPRPEPETKPKPDPQPEPPEPKPREEPEARPDAAPQRDLEAEQGTLLVVDADWPAPTDEELQAVNGTRRYDLPPGAIMGLTITLSTSKYDATDSSLARTSKNSPSAHSGE